MGPLAQLHLMCSAFPQYTDAANSPVTYKSVMLARSASITYSPKAYRRAERAMRCAPFSKSLYWMLLEQSIDLAEVSGPAGYRQQFTRRPLAEVTAEDELMWLIQVGAVRREVDGQGITSRYRLAPIGRQLLVKWGQGDDIGGTANWLEWVLDRLCRWRILR